MKKGRDVHYSRVQHRNVRRTGSPRWYQLPRMLAQAATNVLDQDQFGWYNLSATEAVYVYVRFSDIPVDDEEDDPWLWGEVRLDQDRYIWCGVYVGDGDDKDGIDVESGRRALTHLVDDCRAITGTHFWRVAMELAPIHMAAKYG